jgi:hypothetical protein
MEWKHGERIYNITETKEIMTLWDMIYHGHKSLKIMESRATTLDIEDGHAIDVLIRWAIDSEKYRTSFDRAFGNWCKSKVPLYSTMLEDARYISIECLSPTPAPQVLVI